MIVTCDACQTRFRIPDEKVTEKGVKVRCTKCQTVFRVARPAAPPEVSHVPPPVADADFDPFAAFSPTAEPNSDEATRPFTLSAEAMAKLGITPPSAPAPAPRDDSPFGEDEDPFAHTTRMVPNPERAGSASGPPPLPAPARVAPDPFAAFDPLQPAGAAAADPFASTQPAYPQETQPAFGGGSAGFGDGDPFGSQGPGFGQDAGFGPDAGFGEPSNPGFGMPAAFSDATQPGLSVPKSGPERDAFGSPDASLDPNQSGPFSPPMDRALFDMPAPRSQGLLGDVPPAGFAGAELPEEVTATGVLPMPPAPPRAQAVPERIEPQRAPEGPHDPGPAPAEGGGAIRSVGGAIVNIAAAVLLLAGVAAVAAVYLNGGRVDLSSLSVDHLAHLWARQGDVVPRDVSNGLYDTQGDHAVLFVRGFVENRTGRAGKVKVTAEIYDGDQLLRPATVYAGMSPTPEDLAAIRGQPDLEALVAKLNAAAQPVPPGARVPFLVPFYEYPTELTGLRMKVTASAPEAATAKR